MGIVHELKDFDPFTTEDPVGNLTLAIRGLRAGDEIRLPDGTVVKSTVMRRGAGSERVFAVQPPEDKSTAKERHRELVLGRGVHRRADVAAKKALGK